MIELIVASVAIFSIFTMAGGQGGGNLYVPILVALGLPIHQVATTIENAEKIAKELVESRVWGSKGKRTNTF